MAVHDFLCPACGTEYENVYVPLKEFDSFTVTCACGRDMEYDLRSKTKRNTRAIKFKEFTLHHTRRLDGSREGREIRSLADIRAFEKEHQDTQVCVEAFSYDTQQHIPDPQTQAEPVRMNAQQKRDFVEKFRAMDIKDERSARDY